MSGHRVLALFATLLACVNTWAVGQAVRLGSELQVNSYTSQHQSRGAVAISANGGFVVVWQSDPTAGSGRDGSESAIFGQRFTSEGARQGGEFLVNSYTPNSQTGPSVAMELDGDFVVVWQSFAADGSFSGVSAQRFDSTGARRGGEIVVNTYTLENQYQAKVAMESEGDFAVVWASESHDPGHGVFAQRFTSAGARLGGEFQVNTYTFDFQLYPDIAMDADGDFVVAWNSSAQDPGNGVFAQRFDSSGTRSGVEFQVHSVTLSNQYYPSVAMNLEGDFVVAWQSEYRDPTTYAVFGQRFASSGARQGAEFQINVFTPGNQAGVDVAIDADGGFVAVWNSQAQDPNVGVFGRAFDSSGAPLGGEFQVNAYTPGSQLMPEIAMTSSGGFVVVWTSASQDGNGNGVFARRFEPLATLDVDGDGEVLPLTDGLLVLRYLFGFRGAVLVTGAYDELNCSRCTAEAMEDFIAALL